MKRFFTRLCIAVLAAATLAAGFVVPAQAWGYSSDYRLWSQGCSAYPDMVRWGCWVVAQAKLLYESGVERSASFNPDVYLQWQQKHGLINGNFGQMDGSNAPVRYAGEQGKKLQYLGLTTSDCEKQIWENIANGYFSIIRVYNPKSGNNHYIMVDNADSSEYGILYCYNSFTADSYAPISSLKSRSYVSISRVYTYAAPVQDNVESGYAEADDSVVSVQIKNNPCDKSGALANNVIFAADAHLTAKTVKNIASKVTEHGCYLWEDGSTNKLTVSQKPSSDYRGRSNLYSFFDVNKDFEIELEKGTRYWYQIYAVVDGVKYVSEPTGFVTCAESIARSFVVEKEMEQMNYLPGDKVNTAGLVLEVLYSDGKKACVSEGFTVSDPTLQTTGTELLTISYGPATAEIEVSVFDPESEMGCTEVFSSEEGTYEEYSVAFTAMTNEQGVSLTFADEDAPQATLASRLLDRWAGEYATLSSLLPGKEMQLYDVALSDHTVQMENPAEVSFPLPEKFSSDELSVYRLKGGEAEEIQCFVEDGNVRFMTDELGTFAIVSNSAGCPVGWLLAAVMLLGGVVVFLWLEYRRNTEKKA